VADANNWETSDLTGTRRAPPTTRTITFGGLVANDRAFLAEVDTAGGIDVTKNQNTIDAGGVSAGAATLTLGTTVALDVHWMFQLQAAGFVLLILPLRQGRSTDSTLPLFLEQR
jgi:hypothetical protein